jgi:hypothetical protein
LWAQSELLKVGVCAGNVPEILVKALRGRMIDAPRQGWKVELKLHSHSSTKFNEFQSASKFVQGGTWAEIQGLGTFGEA